MRLRNASNRGSRNSAHGISYCKIRQAAFQRQPAHRRPLERHHAEPGLVRIEVVATQADVICRAEAQITVTASLVTKAGIGDSTYPGIPGYTYHKAARGDVAFALRCRMQPRGHQQWPPGFRLRRAQQVAQAAVHLPAVRQGTGAQELRGHSAGSASRALAGTDVVYRGESAPDRTSPAQRST